MFWGLSLCHSFQLHSHPMRGDRSTQSTYKKAKVGARSIIKGPTASRGRSYMVPFSCLSLSQENPFPLITIHLWPDLSIPAASLCASPCLAACRDRCSGMRTEPPALRCQAVGWACYLACLISWLEMVCYWKQGLFSCPNRTHRTWPGCPA